MSPRMVHLQYTDATMDGTPPSIGVTTDGTPPAMGTTTDSTPPATGVTTAGTPPATGATTAKVLKPELTLRAGEGTWG